MRTAGQENSLKRPETGVTINASAVLESTTDGVILLDRDWRFVWLNERAKAMISPGRDVLGKVVWQEFPRPPGGLFESTCRKVMAERFPQRCEDFYAPLGMWFENSIYPCGDGVALYFRDITAQKAQAQALRDSEEQSRLQLAELEAIYASAPVGLAVLTPDLHFIRVNQRMAAINGFSVAAHFGKSLRDLSPALADMLEPIGRRVAQTGEAVRDLEVEGETPGRPGEARCWIAQWVPQNNADGRVVSISVVVEDVTERKHAERALREQTEELRAVLDAVPAAVLVAHDPACRTITGNRTCEELLRVPCGSNPSISAGDAVLRHYRILKDGVELLPEELPMQKAAATGETARGFVLQVAFDGGDMMHIYGHAAPLFDHRGKPRGAVGAFVDVSAIVAAREADQRRQEKLLRLVEERTEALQLSMARMRSVFETTFLYQGLMTTDGVLLDANPTSLAGINARREDVLGKHFWETPWFTATPGMPEMVAASVPLVAAGQTVQQEIDVNLPTGRRTFDFTMRPVRDSNGTVIAIVPEAIELTERRAAEEQLRQLHKMEAVGQLTGGLAHDFNNLLAGVSGSLELLERRLSQGRFEEIGRHVVTAQAAVQRAAALTHRLLSFSRRQTLAPVATDINHLVVGMVELIRRTVGPAITVEVMLGRDLGSVLVDQNQLENALLNICINARDAMPGGGTLTIETAAVALDDRMAREAELPIRCVALHVTDTGCGMPPEIVAQAFDPFFTTKPAGEGTGLGLSMVYGFVRQSGGQVRIDSVPGSGTTVRLYFPPHGGPADVATQSGEMAAAVRARQGDTVLLVDDEAALRALIAEVLTEHGYTVIEATGAAAAIEILQSDARVDLLVTDVGLTGRMNGRQLADAARDVRPGLQVLFVTGFAEQSAIGSQPLAAGLQVMTKPFAINTLVARVTDLIRAGQA